MNTLYVFLTSESYDVLSITKNMLAESCLIFLRKSYAKIWLGKFTEFGIRHQLDTQCTEETLIVSICLFIFCTL